MMYVAIAVAELHLPYCRDLKSKRRIVHSIVEKLRERHRVSVAETGMQGLHQRAEIGLALVASSMEGAEHGLEAARAMMEQAEAEGVLLTSWNPQIFEDLT
jgi:hypothetical protein